jgi:hypothetical protein
MSRAWSWLVDALRYVTVPVCRAYRILLPRQGPAVLLTPEVPLDHPAPPTCLSPRHTAVARDIALERRRRFEQGRLCTTLARSLPPGATCRTVVVESYGGGRARHLLIAEGTHPLGGGLPDGRRAGAFRHRRRCT